MHLRRSSIDYDSEAIGLHPHSISLSCLFDTHRRFRPSARAINDRYALKTAIAHQSGVGLLRADMRPSTMLERDQGTRVQTPLYVNR
jgi:hypothetical protein